MKKPIAILFFAMFLITAFGQVDSLKNASLIGQASRNQKVGRGFQIGFIGSSDDTCQINTKLQIVPNAGSGKVLTSDANGFGTWQSDTIDPYRVAVSDNAGNIVGQNNVWYGAVADYIGLITPGYNWLFQTDLNYTVQAGGEFGIDDAAGNFSYFKVYADYGVCFVGEHNSATYIKTVDSTGVLTIKINGTEAAGNLLTSDANGNSTWQSPDTTIVSGAASLNLIATKRTVNYSFTGTTTTWTLPAVASNTGVHIYIKNRGSGAITLNSNAGSNDIYNTSAANSLTINAGEAYILINDGTYWTVN